MYVIVGLGITGLSCVRFLQKKGIPCVVVDTRQNPPFLEECRKEFPTLAIFSGNWPEAVLNQADTFVVSPGVSVEHPILRQAKARGAAIIGDIELFAQFNQKPVIAITGSNGKSTVTQLVGEMAQASGKKAAIIGNIGKPVLDLLTSGEDYDLAVMELSSFQLETTSHLQPLVATVLNITPDHLDRYPSFKEYAQAKHRIYFNAQNVVLNKNAPLTMSPSIPTSAKRLSFSLQEPLAGEFGLRDGWLAYGEEKLFAISDLKILGQHNVENVLAALALGTAAKLDLKTMLQTLKTFTGLPHRCQILAHKNNIRWINDSKGTNVGASQASIEGVGQQISGKIILFVGGDGKGADFAPLRPFVERYCRTIIAMGRDGNLMLSILGKATQSYQVENMQEAVALAHQIAEPGDAVMLSPACASWDQYRDYAHRGEVFAQSVKNVLGESLYDD